jgi:hypothetical protein
LAYNDFLGWVDVDMFAEACHNICNEKILNESTNRMMKEKFILGSLQLCNHANNIDWVDQRDYDVKFHAWTEGNVEVKTGNSPMFSHITGKAKKNIKIKLKNVYESKQQRLNLDKEFDHLMIIQIQGTFAIGFVDFATVNQNLTAVTDGFLVNLSHDHVNIVYKKDMKKEPLVWTEDLSPKTWIMSTLAKAMGVQHTQKNIFNNKVNT